MDPIYLKAPPKQKKSLTLNIREILIRNFTQNFMRILFKKDPVKRCRFSHALRLAPNKVFSYSGT